MSTDELDIVAAKKSFVEFLERIENSYEISTDTGRYAVDLDKLRDYCTLEDVHDRDLVEKLLDNPTAYLASLTAALEEVELHRNSNLKVQPVIKVYLKGHFGSRTISPRDLLSHYVEKIVNVRGIVTKCTAVRQKLTKIRQFCEATQTFSTRVYRDATTLKGAPTSFAIVSRDESGNKLTTEYGLSTYSDQQCITVQEMPEHAPSGQLPRSVDVVLEGDLVDMCKPGDRVDVVGVYKVIPSKLSNVPSTSGTFRTLIVAINVTPLVGEISVPHLTSEDVEKIKEMSKRNPHDLLALLGSSLAPSIFGHETIKQALVLLLVGGVEKNLQNGTHIRGDINCLMVGDPSVAKSQLLRCVMGVAPFAISTTGKGSSGVGLTAAVSTDQDTGEKRLEAGAMVLADRGIVCIDEFDKMNDADRVAIHEVMEQQTVTIAKAGIHASLNARCSVLAAANPIYGTYDHSQPVQRNINLPDSLLSRFDILFVVLDESNTWNDRIISSHVLAMHACETSLSCTVRGGDTTANISKTSSRERIDTVSKDFLKKFISYVKKRRVPELTIEAQRCLAEYYSNWRNSKSRAHHDIPVTARTLETMIRLSTAHAKLRLSKTVDELDATVALEIMTSIMERDVTKVKAVDPYLSSHTLQPFDYFCRELSTLTERSPSVPLSTLKELVHTWDGCNAVVEEDVKSFLQTLQNDGKIMIDDSHQIHRI